MDSEKIGAAIRTLRNVEGYTQQELAEYIGVTDKAVSKWERGLSVPDISIFPRLANVLNADIDNLLEGNISYLDDTWRGILIIEAGDVIKESAIAYDKPMIDIWLSYFLLAGIRDVVIYLDDPSYIQNRFGDGFQIGMRIRYEQNGNKLNLHNVNTMVVKGSPFLYGVNFTRYMQRAMSRRNGISYLAAKNIKGEDKVFYDNERRVVKQSNGNTCVLIPVCFVSKYHTSGIKAISDLKNEADSMTFVELCGNGFFACEIKTYEDLSDVSNFIRITERITGSSVYDIEEIAINRGFK